MVAMEDLKFYFPLIVVAAAALAAFALMLGQGVPRFTQGSSLAGAAYTSLTDIPANYAPPWNPYDYAQFLTVTPTRSGSTVTVSVSANHPNMIFYKYFYVSTNGAWEEKYAFPDDPITGTNWIAASAAADVNVPAASLGNENYVIVFGCVQDGGAWHCGCRNALGTACGNWSIQNYSRPPDTSQYSCTGTLPGNATLCADDDQGLTQNTPITLVTSCTTGNKCEYACNAPTYFLNGSKCSLNASLCSPSGCNGKTMGVLFCGTNLSRVYSCDAASASCIILNDTRTCGASQVCAIPGTIAQCTFCNATMPLPGQLACGANTGFLCSNAAPWTVNGTVCASGTCTLNSTTGLWGCIGSCTPNCMGKTCGNDGCGGSCGTCSSGTCNATGQCTTSCQSTCTAGTYQCLHNQNCPLTGSPTCDQVQQCQQVQTGCYQWVSSTSCWQTQVCSAATGTCVCPSGLPVACGTVCCPTGTTNCGTNSCTPGCTPSKTCANYPNQCGTGFSDGCANSLTCTCPAGSCSVTTGQGVCQPSIQTCRYNSTTPPSGFICSSTGCAGTNVVVGRWNADARNTITNQINLGGTIYYFDSCCASAASCADNTGACILQGNFLDPSPGNQWYLCTKDASNVPYIAVCNVNTYGTGDYSLTVTGTTYYCTRTGTSPNYVYGWSSTPPSQCNGATPYAIQCQFSFDGTNIGSKSGCTGTPAICCAHDTDCAWGTTCTPQYSAPAGIHTETICGVAGTTKSVWVQCNANTKGTTQDGYTCVLDSTTQFQCGALYCGAWVPPPSDQQLLNTFLSDNGLQATDVVTHFSGNNLIDLQVINKHVTSISTIPQMVHLTSLQFQITGLGGPFPSGFCNLINLNYLSAGNNGFTGAIPACLSGLTGLNYLFLGGNSLSGTVPSALNNLPLVSADFTSNCLTMSPLPAVCSKTGVTCLPQKTTC